MNLLDMLSARGAIRLLLPLLSLSGTLSFGLLSAGCGGDSPSGGKVASAASASQASAKEEEEEADGEKIYLYKCASCHLPDGKGIAGQFPPLDGSKIATGDPTVPIRIVMHGLSGPLVVEGKNYEGLMPGWGTQLSSAEIAAVLTHVRSEWSNSADEITTAQVEEVKAKVASRTTPWTAAELGLK